MNDALLLLEQALPKVIYPKYYFKNAYALAPNMKTSLTLKTSYIFKGKNEGLIFYLFWP